MGIQFTPEAGIWLGVSLIAALLLDAFTFRAALALLGPPSRSVFLAGRLAHLIPLVIWLIVVHQVYWPWFITPDIKPPLAVLAGEFFLVMAAFSMAMLSYPKAAGRPHA